ncbi:MocR-like pyridoxine biosynthesis transcription factor PdxR [Spongiimicrobium salis]|uniref:MocR-like pyridoxine biosynthesis transcription factor PdxR n=1 Tax=Spongiimicrobium salis TaxID=1667022 RepID=UPI00374D67DA
MIPYKTLISLDRNRVQPIYLQISNQFIQLIKTGVLPPNTQLPGTRSLADLLKVHRKTMVAAYDELILQGWVVTVPKKGTFVHGNIPLLQQRLLSDQSTPQKKIHTGFSFYKDSRVDIPIMQPKAGITYIDDGVSDSRLTPTKEIAALYKSISIKKNTLNQLSYGTTYGNLELRKVLKTYLNQTRGLHIDIDNIMITRGSQMGIHLASRLLVQEGDYVLVGHTNYIAADMSLRISGAQLLSVPVDHNGLDTDAIAELCNSYPIKAIYVTSHHHHPSTVTLSAERRMKLLNLANTYNFAIIEDDYDYDFHYNHAPILPLSSHDTNGNVIYIGSFCKTVAPVYRVGYLIAPKDFVDQSAKIRRFIDRQGDALLELSFAHFIQNGSLDRHIKKVLKIYRERRDLFCRLLQSELGNYFQFEIPKGGMAVWIKLNPLYTWELVHAKAMEQDLEIGNWGRYDTRQIGHNCIRIGFAAHNEKEIHELIRKLKLTMNALGPSSES